MMNEKYRFSKRLIFAAIALSASFSSPVFAQVAPPEKFAHETSNDLKADANIVYGRLDNGLKYAIQRRTNQIGEVSLRFRIAGGNLNETDSQIGLMHFLEHMAFNGSQKYSQGEFVKILEREGLQFGADTNAFTSPTSVFYKLDMPNSERLDLGLDIFRETADRLTLPQEAIDKERAIILAEKRTRKTIDYVASKEYLNKVYPETLFSKRAFNDDVSVIEKANSDDLIKLYKEFYRPDTSFIVIVGDVDVAKAQKLLVEKFGDWKKPNFAYREPNLGKITTIPYKVDLKTDERLSPNLRFINSLPYAVQADGADLRFNNIIMSIISIASNQRLIKIGVKAKSPILGGNFRSVKMYKSVQGYYADFRLNPVADWHDSLKMADSEYRRIVEYGFTQDEINMATNELEKVYKNDAATYDSVSNQKVADEMLADFENNIVRTGEKQDLEFFNSRKNSINEKVVNSAIKKYWLKDPQLYLVFNKKPDGKTNENFASEISTYWSQIRNEKIEPINKNIIANFIEATSNDNEWLYTDFGVAQKPISTEVIKELGITKVKFNNDVNLIIKPVKEQTGNISVAVNFGDVQASFPKDKVFDMGLLSTAIINGGIKKYHGDDIVKIFNGKKISIALNKNAQSWTFSGKTNSENLETQMQYLAAYFYAPTFFTVGFNRYKSFKEVIYNDVNSDLNKKASLIYWKSFYNNDARFFDHSNEDDFNKVTYNEIKELYNKAITDGPIEILIVGDVNPQQAIEIVGKTFGAFGTYQTMPNSKYNDMTFFPNHNGKYVDTHNGEKSQALLMVAWPSQDGYDGKRKQELQVLKAILQDCLNDEIREKMGGTYAPLTYSIFSEIDKNKGAINARIIVNPDEIEKVEAATLAVAQKLHNGEITEDMFVRAKNPLIAKFKKDKQTNEYWINRLSWSSFVPRIIDNTITAENNYENINLEDIKSIARINFDKNRAQVIQILPAK